MAILPSPVLLRSRILPLSRGGRLSAPALLVCLFGIGFSSFAQTSPSPSEPQLTSILQRLQTNLDAYRQSVPSFFCDEHAVYGIVTGKRRLLNVADSAFRMKRLVSAKDKPYLEESREVETLNGSPASGHSLQAPGMPQGVFSGGLALVSVRQQSCMQYQLQPSSPDRPNAYVVYFATIAGKPACLLSEPASGRVFIDANSMQISHVEVTVPNHAISGAGKYDIHGKWQFTVDYTPIQLENRTFWLPAHIGSRETYRDFVWVFDATYRNYHRLEVTSHIETPAQ